MVITSELAQPVVDKLEEVMDNPVHIINQECIVVASTDASRIGEYHEGAAVVRKSRKELHVSAEDAQTLAGTKEGITQPLEFHGEYLGALGVTGHPDKLSGTASIIRVAVLSLIEQVYLTQQSSYKRKVMDNWVSNLVTDRLEDYLYLRQQAKFLGFDVRKECSIVVVNVRPVTYNEFSMNDQYLSGIVQAQLPLQFYSYIGQGQHVFAVPAKNREDIARLQPVCDALLEKVESMNQQCYIGVGKPDSEIAGYRRSYFDALHSAQIVERLGGEKRVIYYYEHQIFRLLECVPEYAKEIFLDGYLQDGQPADPVLFDTLAVYFEQDKRVNETAAALHIHRNTLIFRLNKIKDILGLDPRGFRDSVTLQIILYLLKFPDRDSKEQRPAELHNRKRFPGGEPATRFETYFEKREGL